MTTVPRVSRAVHVAGAVTHRGIDQYAGTTDRGHNWARGPFIKYVNNV